MNKTDAISRFLSQHTISDLANLYSANMEVQVNVAQDSGSRIEGDYKGRQWHGWTDGIQTWKSFRIPYKAKSEPEYIDRPISFDLVEHAEGIGLTGWDWVNRYSKWVGFDFDALVGHAEAHAKKLTEEELENIKKVITNVPWVTLRKSTSGKGLHLYVFIDNFPTKNHTEHAAVARAILSKLSQEVGFDFNSKVDTCGGNMWFWHRKMKGTDGLILLKEGTKIDSVPANWQEHLRVITGRKTRTLPKFIETQDSETQDLFTQLTSQRIRIQLDQDHKKLIYWMEENYPNSSWWDADHHMYVTHTFLISEAHRELAMKGVFKTVSQGREKGSDHNCFLHPIKKGAWAVRRYSPGVKESVTWEQDGSGWTKCYLNREADLDCAAKAFEGLEDPKGGFEFKTFEQAKQAALLLGVDLNVPNNYLMRKTKLKRHKSGRLCVEFQRETSDPGVNGWVAGTKIWSKLFDVKLFNGSAEPEFLYNDDGIRHIVSEGGDNRGWMIRVENDWHAEPLEHVKAILISGGFKPAEVPLILGHNVAQCWRMVNKPFEEEFLPNRQWNKNAARFRYKPTVEIDNLNYEPWLKVLNHCGESLNEAIKNNVWCQENAIITGGDYLKCWIASLFKYPTEPLPYLFLYGPQGSGKSIFHEALELLFVAGFGYMRADFALISPAGFNGELENSVLCVVEETDLRKNNVAYNRIKDWVTSRQIPIHRKQQQPYLVPNTTHWIQTANSHLYCPVFSGDTRITMIYVDDLKTEERIPKTELITKLEACASDFLAEILNLEVPKSNDRLRIPVLQTEDKAAAERGNQSMLEMFCEEKIYFYEGKRILFSEFYEKFIEWLDPNQIPEWSKVRVSKEMPLKIISGRCRSNNQKYIGNVSWQVKGESDPTLPKLVIRNGHLECA